MPRRSSYSDNPNQLTLLGEEPPRDEQRAGADRGRGLAPSTPSAPTRAPPTPEPPPQRHEPTSHAVAFDGALLRFRGLVLLPVKGAWVVTGVSSGDLVTALLMSTAKSKTLKVAFGALKATYFGAGIVGIVVLQNLPPKVHARHPIDVTGSLPKKAKEPTFGHALDELLRSLDPFSPSK